MPRTAIVAGATRGAGRGIARALGEAGFTVICTGRSVRGEPSAYAMPETLDDTVAMIPGAIAERVDHTDEGQVAALFDRHGDADVVVDSVAGEDPELSKWTGMIDSDLAGLRTALARTLVARMYTATHAARALRARKRGLLVEVTEYDLLFGAGGNLSSALGKCAIKSMVVRLAEELRPHGAAAVAVTPGFLR
jgi:NAD(P)-dependent dehydrogenase (short-subunit alcohol dehydrogenase family)